MFTGPHDHRRLVVRDLGPQPPGLLRGIRRLSRRLLRRRPREAAGFAAGHRRLRLRLCLHRRFQLHRRFRLHRRLRLYRRLRHRHSLWHRHGLRRRHRRRRRLGCAQGPGRGRFRSGHTRRTRHPRDPAQHEALPGHHSAPQVRQRVRLDRPPGRAADRQPLERAGHDQVDPGESLLSGYLPGRAALGDRAPHRAAQEHDHAVAHRGHDPERGSISRHVADDPGGQLARDRVGRSLAVGADLGGQPEQFLDNPGRGRSRSRLVPARDHDDRFAEPADKTRAGLDADARRQLLHRASSSSGGNAGILSCRGTSVISS